ncbi:MAG: hemerythrin domain-containing protein [Daejeonella sp.]|uniref:hemerythrin domain-containing protein n=1 Tax=Daejeonella sp. TaxID=2805397 RepID=UPI002733EA26|nr:hemerythrin domain-containing protein [Daejeonella sp.]MDP3468647.1 hemerythrin domain-containing protein [Daejeonella sp.]
MKRHEALIPLSRDHHGTLILARLLRSDAPPYKGLPLDSIGKAEYAMKHYREELLEHFEQEEKMIPMLKGINVTLDNLLASMKAEHQELHSLFNSININQELSSQLDRLGRTIESHVRKEDREIFPLIQECCTEEVLNKLADIFTEK